MKKIALFIAVAMLSQMAVAQSLKTIVSPRENLEVTIFVNNWGVPGYYVMMEGDTLIADSQLGLKYSGSEATGHVVDKANYRWMQTDSTSNKIYNEMVVTLNQPYKGVLKVYARAYDNAVAIKQSYKVDGAEKVFLQDDNTCIYFAKNTMIGDVPIDSLKEFSLPAEFTLNGGKKVVVSSEAKDGYPQIYLTSIGEIENMLKLSLKPMYEGNDHIKLVLPASFETPYVIMEVKE